MNVEGGELLLGVFERLCDGVAPASGSERGQHLGQREGRGHGVKKGRTFGRDEQAVACDADEGRGLAVGEREHGHAAVGGILGAFDCGPRVGADAGHHQDVLGGGGADRVETDAGDMVEQDDAIAEDGKNVVQMPSDGVAGAQAHAVDAARPVEAGGGGSQRVE